MTQDVVADVTLENEQLENFEFVDIGDGINGQTSKLNKKLFSVNFKIPLEFTHRKSKIKILLSSIMS